MKLIECKLGPASPVVGGQPYDFQRDRFGRYVCRIHNDEHAACFRDLDAYREVPEEPLPEPEEQPVPPAQLGIVPPAGQFDDNIGRIKGIGPVVRVKLEGAGVNSLRQIAAWTAEQIATLDADLDLRGVIERMDWVGQAKALLPAEPASA